mmetsp:Transcript_21140/g.3440  ORF Transcript_21140/g.3440 Transcript_21140/m.3440 type:complete len:94 (+) Transcript_21140:901-1182(+)
MIFISILSQPSFLISLVVLAGVYFYLFSVKQIVISGKEITDFQKNVVMAIITLTVTIVLAGSLICSVLVGCMAGSLAHAVFHFAPPTDENMPI